MGAIYKPTQEANALVQLVTQTGELQETFNSFKNRFVSMLLNGYTYGINFDDIIARKHISVNIL